MREDLKTQIIESIRATEPHHVWTPADFASLGGRDAIDKALQRLAKAGELRRIDRGLYDRPRINALTKKPTSPDYRKVLSALARRDQVRMLVDGMTAANDLGLTDAVPAHVTAPPRTHSYPPPPPGPVRPSPPHVPPPPPPPRAKAPPPGCSGCSDPLMEPGSRKSEAPT